MSLKRATKSIPLSGGMTEEVDNFLLEPSGMQYMENIRYTKKDQAEKVEPLNYLAVTGASNYEADTAYGLWSSGDILGVVSNNEMVRSDDAGATWTTYAQNTDLLGMEKVMSTAGEVGGNNFTYTPVGDYVASPLSWTITHYAVAFERINKISGATLSKDVVLQVWDVSGRLLSETIDTGAHSPRIQRITGEKATVIYVDTNNDFVARSFHNSGTSWSGVSVSTRTIRDFNQNYNVTNEGWGAAGAELSFADMRMGYTSDYTDWNCNFAYRDRQDDPEGVVAYKSGAGIYYERTIAGAPQASPVTILPTDADPLYFSILDCETKGNYYYFLLSQTNNTTGTTYIYLYRDTYGGGAMVNKQMAGPYSGPVINGSIRAPSNGVLDVAFTVAQGMPTEPIGGSAAAVPHAVNLFQWDTLEDVTGNWDTGVETGLIRNHRLISEICHDKNNTPSFVVQQWGNWNPGAISGANPDIPALAPAHKKPLTSIHVEWTPNGTRALNLIATYDAGQSKHMPPGMEEQNIHTGNLWYFNQGDGAVGAHQFWFGNRNILVAEDGFSYVSTGTVEAFPDNDSVLALHVGTSRLNVYHLAANVDVHYENFDHGMFVGTSVPVWFDGSRSLTEIAPLDSPEIINLDSDLVNVPSYVAYQDLAISGQDVKIYTAVTGFYDDQGVVHRSAPSVPVYGGNMGAANAASFEAIVTVTAPISLAEDGKFFFEIYESEAGGNPSLAATGWFEDSIAGSLSAVRFRTNANPTTGVKPIDLAGFRGSKIIYTDGNVLAADPWPSFDFTARTGNRVFAHSIGDPSTLYYSKTFENGVVPEFSAALTITLGNEAVTALGAIDDKILAFTRSSIFVIYGAGPDNTGANGDFLIEKFPHAQGCTTPRSVLQYQDGIAFLSSTTGEYALVTRDLQVVDIGEHVKSITEDSTFTPGRALVYPAAHELQWHYTMSARSTIAPAGDTTLPVQPPRAWIQSAPPIAGMLVYNYRYAKWSVVDRTGRTMQLTTVRASDGKPVGLVGMNIYETGTDWSDGKLTTQETPWIKVNQLQDYGRFYGADFLGKYLSSWNDNGGDTEAGDIQVTVHYDYEIPNVATDEVHRFRANQDLKPANGDRLQFEVRPKRQKCQAIKFVVEEVATEQVEVWEPTYTTGQGFIISAVDLHYGAKGGSSRLPAGRKR